MTALPDGRRSLPGHRAVPDRRLAGADELPAAACPSEELDRRRDAVVDLGSAVRDLVAACVATEVDVDELLDVAAQARDLAERLGACRRERHEPSSVDDPARGQRFFNPVVGLGNPLAPPLQLEIVGEEAVGRVTLDLPYEGPFTYAHGGISALLLDQVMGYACAAAGYPAVTGRLEVRYTAAVPLGRPLVVRARVADALGVRVAVHGTVALADAPDDALIRAEGRFLVLRPEQAKRLFRPPG